MPPVSEMFLCLVLTGAFAIPESSTADTFDAGKPYLIFLHDQIRSKNLFDKELESNSRGNRDLKKTVVEYPQSEIYQKPIPHNPDHILFSVTQTDKELESKSGDNRGSKKTVVKYPQFETYQKPIPYNPEHVLFSVTQTDKELESKSVDNRGSKKTAVKYPQSETYQKPFPYNPEHVLFSVTQTDKESKSGGNRGSRKTVVEYPQSETYQQLVPDESTSRFRRSPGPMPRYEVQNDYDSLNLLSSLLPKNQKAFYFLNKINEPGSDTKTPGVALEVPEILEYPYLENYQSSVSDDKTLPRPTGGNAFQNNYALLNHLSSLMPKTQKEFYSLNEITQESESVNELSINDEETTVAAIVPKASDSQNDTDNLHHDSEKPTGESQNSESQKSPVPYDTDRITFPVDQEDDKLKSESQNASQRIAVEDSDSESDKKSTPYDAELVWSQ